MSVCGVGDHREYFGASDLVRDGNVCRYSTYVLNLSPTSPSRLEREARPPLTHMLVSESSTRPSPEAIKHAQIFADVQQDVLEQLVRVWRDAISSPASFDRTVSLELPDGSTTSRAPRHGRTSCERTIPTVHDKRPGNGTSSISSLRFRTSTRRASIIPRYRLALLTRTS